MTSTLDANAAIGFARQCLDDAGNRFSIHVYMADLVSARNALDRAVTGVWELCSQEEREAIVRHCAAVDVPFSPPGDVLVTTTDGDMPLTALIGRHVVVLGTSGDTLDHGQVVDVDQTVNVDGTGPRFFIDVGEASRGWCVADFPRWFRLHVEAVR